MKVAYVFAGQGAQKVGMGHDFFRAFESSASIYAKASLAMGYSMETLCFEGPQSTLNQTERTQPAILTTSIAMLRAFEAQTNVRPLAVAGLSLGEYSAHVAAGSLAFEDAVRLVKKRGRWMQNAVPEGDGAMAAILGLPEEIVAAVIEPFDGVEISNYNAPAQFVIGGPIAAVAAAAAALKAAGAKRAVQLPVSAPFHTKMLWPAREKLAEALSEITFSKPHCPVVSNVDAKPLTNEKSFSKYLAAQVTESVQWIRCVETLAAMGAETIIAFGPGDALKPMIQKIDRNLNIYSIYDLASLNTALDAVNPMPSRQRAV